MSALREVIHENVREGELYEKLDRDWVNAGSHRSVQRDGLYGVAPDA